METDIRALLVMAHTYFDAAYEMDVTSSRLYLNARAP